MRAAVVLQPGTLPVCTDFPDPEPRAGSAEVELVAAGVHWVARSLSSGAHYASGETFPQVPGVDAVARTADGRLVYTGWPRDPWGTMAERMVVPMTVDLPAGADPLTVAAGMNPALSGHLAVRLHAERSGVPGTVLVLGATGLAGDAAVRSALELGAERVVAAGRRPDALAGLAALGAVPADLTDDAVASLLAALGGRVPDLVVDFVWGPVAEAAFAALARRGSADDEARTTYTQVGSLAGATAALPSSLLRSRRIQVVGHGLGSVPRARLVEAIPDVLARLADGRFTAPCTAYPLAEVGRAWEHAGPDRAVVVP